MQLLSFIEGSGFLDKDQNELNQAKNLENTRQKAGDYEVYSNSLYLKDKILWGMAWHPSGKFLFTASKDKALIDALGLRGSKYLSAQIHLALSPLTVENSKILRKHFPFTSPVSLRSKKTTIGLGDRLGRASAGHLRLAKQYDFFPVCAQQSIRELTLTKRDFPVVVADTAFMVFQEGYEKGYGGDGDHLKTMEDIDTAIDAGMPMITLDLTEVMNPDPAEWPEAEVNDRYSELPEKIRTHMGQKYGGKTFNLGKAAIPFPEIEAKRCALMYWDALDFAAEVNLHLRKRLKDQYDLEISVDETTAPTLPSHHLFFASELAERKVTVNSLAPRFIGEFQKGIDYMGDKREFEKQFIEHCMISREFGGYKISVHSGSDKFAVYPVVGKETGLRLHLKTAGTNWLEALRTIAQKDPALYRLIHRKSFEYFPEATRLYHITADLSKIPELESRSDDALPLYLEQDESRQLLHISYGGLLGDPEVRKPFFQFLHQHEEDYYANLIKHIGKHVSLLGIPKA